ncbi:MAG: winged helix-turn-helix transcriptional regulator [Candidatus Brockarchaeota archaeon]|nr:winged helix-turn-helix transcriptional regulator [Candidatus Brockarchaeota archaeon]
MATAEFIRRLGKTTDMWGLGESVGCIWGALLVEGRAMTQEQLAKSSGYSIGLVSSTLSRLEEMGFVASVGRQGRKRLYVAAMSFVDALESFLKRFVDFEVVPALGALSEEARGVEDAERRSNAEKIIAEYRKARAFIDSLLSLMKKHKDLGLEELVKVLPR